MADASTPARRVAPATIALVLAALLLVATLAVVLFRPGSDEAPPGNVTAPAPAGSTAATAASLRERLRQDPDNDQGWFLLGLTYRNSERFAEAAQAFRRAAELAPRNADYAAYQGEALLLAGGDTPPPEAARLFRRALELQPGNPQARYYLATLKDVGGDHRGAVDDLVALLREAPADAPWAPQVRNALASIAREHHIDLAGRLPAAPAAATAAIPGPTPEQMAAARSIPPSQQDQMVRAMVDGLAARLRQNPRDADGWIRLMRSRMVLHDPDAAAAALRSALAVFPGDAATQARLRAAARELGMP
ncbi:MAG TPA: tetratricopeptide repeat protein [Allosphingosinicella sp.]|nr:tetratricopeptide repeat protein [Allosphingosinicella sp.]